ncbi:hypothetical protein BN1723_019857 [Verticillium longisporum]|uniref:Uncharacterized protein n=1 Tax=Verticillium longisporum TaxID=100787 RepID=A0A0G4NHT4_VERLO|nr:hypothetical protein BN1723_019857 [Verticillium longisporum]
MPETRPTAARSTTRRSTFTPRPSCARPTPSSTLTAPPASTRSVTGTRLSKIPRPPSTLIPNTSRPSTVVPTPTST